MDQFGAWLEDLTVWQLIVLVLGVLLVLAVGSAFLTRSLVRAAHSVGDP
jgi:hypothetical protein